MREQNTKLMRQLEISSQEMQKLLREDRVQGGLGNIHFGKVITERIWHREQGRASSPQNCPAGVRGFMWEVEESDSLLGRQGKKGDSLFSMRVLKC